MKRSPSVSLFLVMLIAAAWQAFAQHQCYGTQTKSTGPSPQID
jgi:hypothetical protein